MTWLQIGYAGMDIITKVALNRGMSHFVPVVYRHAVATAVLAPFSFFLEREKAGNDTENSSTSSEMLPISFYKFENDIQAFTISEAIPPNPDATL
ncbi:hypothetical protein SUGI_1137780 [Cryptomeria japonica]|nr:hypothetical protein SUGI_1137780 [Cryptomeria japonica]